MAKLLSGTRIYGNATVDTFITVGGNITAGNLIANLASANFWIAGNATVGNLIITGNIIGNLNVSGTAGFISNDKIITQSVLNQSIALLRAAAESPPGNVIYVSKNGNDINNGLTLSNALANIHVALAQATEWTTVFVKSGDYTLHNHPVTIKTRVGMVGDNLRTTTIRPKNANVNMFYVENASYVTGITFRDHIDPAAVFSFNPNGSAGTIVTSPYIQNCSSITTTGTGMRVNGAYVTGLRSMVCDSYTQTNAGGIGIHMLNRGYTQLVSVFTICCRISIFCEAGGFCSITNSNSAFGTYGLVADGVSDPLRYGTVVGDTTGQEFIITGLTSRPNYKDAILFANFNQATCSRDTGLIVDSLAIDLAYGSNTQSAFAGLQYWLQATSAIPNQATETIDAFMYAKNLATNVILNNSITSTYQANITQVSGTPATAFEANIINTEFALIANIITGGTTGITARIIPNGYPANTSVNISNASNLLYLNNTFIKAEVIAYVNNVYPTFFSTPGNFIDAANAEATCSRDVGFLLDSVRFDLLHGGNRQAIMAGTYYYQYAANTTQISNQVVQTSAAYNFIGSIIDEVIQNTLIANTYQAVVSQNTTAASAATLAEANAILRNISLISNIITSGPSVAPAKRPIQYTPSTDSNVINATKIILANKDFIKAEVLVYVNKEWANISNGAVSFYTVSNSSPLVANTCTVTLLEDVTDTIVANSSVSFHTPSYIQTSTHTFEYIGSGTELATALPYAGGIPIQGNEVQESRGGAVYFTSTDQQGDFRIGKGILINRVDGTITGRTFNKSLFAVMTPYLLAIEG